MYQLRSSWRGRCAARRPAAATLSGRKDAAGGTDMMTALVNGLSLRGSAAISLPVTRSGAGQASENIFAVFSQRTTEACSLHVNCCWAREHGRVREKKQTMTAAPIVNLND